MDKLTAGGADFIASGNSDGVRRRIYHALSLPGGQGWSPR